MIEKSDIERIDTQKIFKIYDEWPKIAKKSYYSKLEIVDFEKVNHIVFVGMGGSGSLGDFFSAILSKTDLYVNVVKGYLLPKTVNKKTLVIVTSISGNTRETLAVLDSAKKIGCKIVAFFSGGKMEEFCIENNIEYRKIEKHHSPRSSFVGFLYSMIQVLELIIPVKKEDIENSIIELEKTRENISSNNLNSTNEAYHLAMSIDKIPLIYFPWGLQAVAVRFKSSLQENAKTHAIIEDVVEASHNGIVPWEIKSNIEPILLQGKDDFIKTKERWKIFEEYFNENDINFKKIISRDGGIITKLVNLIYILDYTSIYLAIKNNIDPSPVNSIDYIKKRL